MSTGPEARGADSVHEDDVLKRHAGFSWKNFGGDGFMVSLSLHIILAILGLMWAYDHVVPATPKTRNPVFELPGGGSNGVKVTPRTTTTKGRITPAALPTRLVANNKTNADISLPKTSETGAPAFATGLNAGDVSKGIGTGTGGGTGTANGPGNGPGRMNVGVFWTSLSGAGLPGTFYDCKQTPDGAPTAYAGTEASNAFTDEVLRPFIRKFDRTRLDGKYFKAPTGLAASQFLIPHGTADAAPKAYAVEDKCKGSRWIAVYSGLITPPKSGKFRFWGLGDDALVVRIDGKLALDAGWSVLSEPGHANHGAVGKVLGVTETKKGTPGAAFRAGPWISFTKGRDSAIDLMISEIPGGMFGAWLFMEEAGPDGKGDGRLFLFRLTKDTLPEDFRDNSGLDADLTGKGLIWNGRAAKNEKRR